MSVERLDRDACEWLEADGLGGFASGTVNGVRTRRYHGLLLVATQPPTGRVMFVNGFDAWIETADGRRHALSSQRYAPDVIHPDGASRIESFTPDPWPTWVFALDSGLRVQQEIIVPHERAMAIVTWRLLDPGEAGGADDAPAAAVLIVRPFLSGRDYHATHHENPVCRTEAREEGRGLVVWQPYASLPAIRSRANARYDHQPDWYRRFEYRAERERGLDDVEDLMAPGWLTWELTGTPERAGGHTDPGEAIAVWCLDIEPANGARVDAAREVEVVHVVTQLREAERARRAAFASPLHRAADAYLVRRGAGRTIVAGYPWFTDWGRDTFVALRGLCLATGRLDVAREILLEWAGLVSDGMLPNRFPDAGDSPEFNAVDASLWFVAAVQAFCGAGETDAVLLRAVREILTGYARGTRYGIRLDRDGLIACGVPGLQLTWMDARSGDRVMTPRIGKPVEVQALWLNALAFAQRAQVMVPSGANPLDADAFDLDAVYARGRATFASRFWYADGQYLYDVIDVDHQPGRVDAACRPNQIFAIGGLPLDLLDPVRARLVVDTVERRLLTPLGLRSLAPGEPGYAAHYRGGPDERDAAYHQGTAWPWLLGAFVDAWLRVRGETDEAAAEARRRFIDPLLVHRDREAGIGHISEIADAEPPFTPRGCPFQAWSLGELLWLLRRTRAT